MPSELGQSKSATLVSAAMETAGAAIQSDMLDFVSNADGMSLAGLLYLIAIVGALIAFASGGNYKWGRYLLVGPALFFFLTTVRVNSDGTDWSFGNKDFSKEAITKALSGVSDLEADGGTRVSLFYKFWNAFTSEVSHTLLSSLNLDKTDSEYNFIQKVERYMNLWNFAHIRDPDLRLLIKITISAQCLPYFDALRQINGRASLDAEKDAAELIIKDLAKKPILITSKEGPTNGMSPELYQWLQKNQLDGEVHTCESLWKKLVPIAREEVGNTISQELELSLAPGQDLEKVRETFLLKVSEYNGLYSNALDTNNVTGGGAAASLYAIDWIVAKSLWEEVWEQNSYTTGAAMEGFSPIYMTGRGGNLPGWNAEYNETTTGAIQQFNKTDKYGQRSEYVTAALSLPYFQGVGLLILAASFPFFAMMTVIPGRALNFLSWMGLWLWLKLWDLGFGVVMLIDNMLYSMFPRGPNITPEEMKNAGVAWTKLFEVDPNYSQAVYYNIIATCLFAVPLVTGVFVRGGGGELQNLIGKGWTNYASRIAGGAASFSRAMQAQSLMKGLQQEIFANTERAMNDQKKRLQPDIDRYHNLIAEAKVLSESSDATRVSLAPATQEKAEQLRRQIENSFASAAAKARYDVEISQKGQYAANRAVAAGYYSHDLRNSNPFEQYLKEEMDKTFFDGAKVFEPVANAAVAGAGNTITVAGGKE